MGTFEVVERTSFAFYLMFHPDYMNISNENEIVQQFHEMSLHHPLPEQGKEFMIWMCDIQELYMYMDIYSGGQASTHVVREVMATGHTMWRHRQTSQEILHPIRTPQALLQVLREKLSVPLHLHLH